MQKYSYITLNQRREIERMHDAGARTEDIAKALGKPTNTIFVELRRSYTGECTELMTMLLQAVMIPAFMA